MDTLAFGYILPTTGRIRDFNPLETCAARRTSIEKRESISLSLFIVAYSPCPGKCYILLLFHTDYREIQSLDHIPYYGIIDFPINVHDSLLLIQIDLCHDTVQFVQMLLNPEIGRASCRERV